MATKCKFQGPAESEFVNFQDQALSMLNNSCPRWNDENHPKSYIVPPIFYFNYPEKPDHELETGNFNRYITHRTSDDAERMIFDALKTLINEGFAAPFFVFHDFDVNRISTRLDQIFPDLIPSVANRNFGEYDYVLIGRKIGIVVIEVKSTAFTQARDFNLNLFPQHQHLPEQYQHGIKQLRSFDDVLDLLEILRVTSSANIDRTRIRRILFTPNLKRVRYNEWFHSLDASRRNHVNECVEGIDRWFSDDAQPTSQLYVKLRSYLGEGDRLLGSSKYEHYIPILCGLSSVTFTKVSDRYNIDREVLSEAAAVLRVSDCLDTQNPLSLNMSSKKHKKQETAEKTNHETTELWKAIILTPEQSATLLGPPRQFILGAAGTGKTLIIQAKVLEAARKGESVLVLSSAIYTNCYVHFFERHKLNGCSAKFWEEIITYVGEEKLLILFQMLVLAVPANDDPLMMTDTFIHRAMMDPALSSRIIKDYFKEMLDYDHILIDDTLAEIGGRASTLEQSLTILYTMFVLAELKQVTSRWKTFWIALDPFTKETYFCSSEEMPTEQARAMHRLFNAINQFACCHFGITYLKQVMRNPENIFQALFPMSTNVGGPYETPRIGHKIHGSRIVKTIDSFDSLKKEISDLLECVKDKYPLEEIAIIGTETSLFTILVKFLRSREIPFEGAYYKTYLWKEQSEYDSSAAAAFESPRGKLGVHQWSLVNSMEWSLVICITHLQHRLQPRIMQYRKYRTCSRATGMLVEMELDLTDPHSFFGENSDERTNFLEGNRDDDEPIHTSDTPEQLPQRNTLVDMWAAGWDWFWERLLMEMNHAS